MKRRTTYSLSEIDAMRKSVDMLATSLGGSWDPRQRAAEVEDRLRTYMQNGTDPEELSAAATEHWHQEGERWRQNQLILAAKQAPALKDT